MSSNTANLYELREGQEKIKEIELALQYIKDVVSAISKLSISGDIIDEVYQHLDEIETCANNIDDIIAVSNDIVDVTAVAQEIDKVVICANNITDIVTVAGVSTDVTTVASNVADLQLVADDLEKGKGTNQPTDSAILNALDNALEARDASNDAEQARDDVVNNYPLPSFPDDEGLALVARQAGNDWEKILGLPDETGNKGKSVTNNGVEGDSFWSPVTTNPNVLTEDYTIATGTSATVASGFTIDDGVTLTIPDGSTLGVV